MIKLQIKFIFKTFNKYQFEKKIQILQRTFKLWNWTISQFTLKKQYTINRAAFKDGNSKEQFKYQTKQYIITINFQTTELIKKQDVLQLYLLQNIYIFFCLTNICKKFNIKLWHNS